MYTYINRHAHTYKYVHIHKPVANREHYSWAFSSAITTEKINQRGKKQQCNELKGFNKCNPLINDDKDVNK